jgi:3-oxoacyl-[acyl-carrier protein] reductase
MFDLTGRRALVTGLAEGVAGAIALELARRGCDIAFLDQSPNTTGPLQSKIKALGRRCLAGPADLTAEASVARAIEEMASALGGIDLLVNGAEEFQDGFILDVSEDQWDRMLAVNLKSVFLCSKAIVPHMLKGGRGRIVNVSSLSGKDPTPPAAVNYAASKAGVLGFTRQLARQLAPHGITVNAVAPLLPAESPAPSPTALINRIPLGRYASAEDVAKAVAFLASDESGFITGETLDLSSGLYKY